MGYYFLFKLVKMINGLEIRFGYDFVINLQF